MISLLPPGSPYVAFREREFKSHAEKWNFIAPTPERLEREARDLLRLVHRMPYARRTLLFQARAKRSLARYLVFASKTREVS